MCCCLHRESESFMKISAKNALHDFNLWNLSLLKWIVLSNSSRECNNKIFVIALELTLHKYTVFVVLFNTFGESIFAH